MRKKLIISGILMIVVAAGGVLIFGKNLIRSQKETSTEGTVSNASSQLPVYSGESITYIGNDPMIDQLPKSAVDQKKKDLAELAESLKKNPANFDGWMTVGIHKKFFNNYQGARDAWEYAKLVTPENSIVYLNLANLYGYYLNDLKKAEINYLAAVQYDLNQFAGSYYATANFYRDFGLKEKALAYYEKILQFDPQNTAIKTEIQRLK